MADANRIDVNGITIQTLAEIIDEIVNGSADKLGLKQIFGSDINVDPNSPDGQWVNNLALEKNDVLQLCVAVYNSLDPDAAVGVSLDAIAQLCGITRKGGTYTTVDVAVVVSQNLNLNGLDNPAQPPFTIADSNGNQFQLITSASLTTGSNTLLFQAAKIGAVTVLANTLTVMVSIIPGVTSVNNPSGPVTTGANQETDADFRVRRANAVSKPSQGYFQSLLSALLDLEGVTSAEVYENTTGSTDGDGVPSHSIWVVVQGGTAADIGAAIYKYRNAGCGMYGSQTVTIMQIDGSTFDVKYDISTNQDLYVKFHLEAINGASLDSSAIVAALVAGYKFSINSPADITTVANIIKAFNPNAVVAQCQVSNDNITWADIVSPTTKDKIFVLTAGNVTLL